MEIHTQFSSSDQPIVRFEVVGGFIEIEDRVIRMEMNGETDEVSLAMFLHKARSVMVLLRKYLRRN